jgi:hypothetical protein
MKKIIIEIRGGVVQNIVSNSGEIQIAVIDYDNDEISKEFYDPDLILKNEEFEKYLSEL